FAELAQALIDLHYDPAYDRAARKSDAPILARLALEPLDPQSRASAARTVIDLIPRAFGSL
ncbi:MAG: tRNA 2-selenouridine(34) synthase MnmH, partial [Phenylobacterium sp.]|nr:tRNA 2-selenouridine(34) synthase MnmH [Phenylobacterium sp.]